MAKDPALLFYTSDFLSSTQGLTLEETGMLIKLLCVQHQNGHLTEKAIKLSVGEVSVDVLSFFQKDENGLYFNERLDKEKERRAKFTESRRKNIQKRYEEKSTYVPTSVDTSVVHMETETKTVTETETENKTENDIKGLYGALNNVRLSVVEYEKIKEKFPKSYKRYIDDLSFYIGEKGDKYTSHYLVILKWNRDKKEDMCSFDTDDFFEAAIRRSEEHIKARLREAEEKKRLTQEVSP